MEYSIVMWRDYEMPRCGAPNKKQFAKDLFGGYKAWLGCVEFVTGTPNWYKIAQLNLYGAMFLLPSNRLTTCQKRSYIKKKSQKRHGIFDFYILALSKSRLDPPSIIYVS